jgi:hypothetical protein
VIKVPASGGAVYKGLAVGRVGHHEYLYATDFHNGRIDVFDSSFHLGSTEKLLPGFIASRGV